MQQIMNMQSWSLVSGTLDPCKIPARFRQKKTKRKGKHGIIRIRGSWISPLFLGVADKRLGVN